MAARGLLENPALFAGFDVTPIGCVEKYIQLATQLGTPSYIIQNHILFMTERLFCSSGTYL